MAIEKMKMVSILGKYESLDDTIQAYLDSGYFQPESASQLVTNVKGFTSINDENPYASRLSRLTDILHMSEIEPVAVKDPGPTPDDDVINAKLDVLNERLGALQDQRLALGDEIKHIKEALSQLSHFESLDIDLQDVIDSQYVSVRFGRLPAESYEKLKFYNSNPYVLFFPCSTENEYLWGMYVAPSNSVNEVDSIFNSLFFEKLSISENDGTPKEVIEKLTEKLKTDTHNYAQLDIIIKEFNELEMDDYLKLYTQLKRSYDAFEIRRYATRYGDSFMLIGWVPNDDVEAFSAYMDKVDDIEYSFENPDAQNSIEPPIKLKNPKLFKPFEYYVEMFGVPSYNEIDPTPFMAITYTLLFGIMFADFGQGLVLALVGYLMYKIKGMKLGKILVSCGIAGSLFGLVFGSVFGFEHLLDPMYHALGFEKKPIEIMESINQILIAAVAIGVVMMILAICLNIYCSLKRRQFGEALVNENGLCGLFIYVSIIGLILSLFVPAVKAFELVFLFAIIICIILLLFKEPISWRLDGKGKFKPESSMAEYAMQSFFEMFESLLSYITNTVSFLRVGAFVLVHSGMMMVFFTLAEMSSSPVVSGIVIFLGNILVLVLEGLLVGVQSLRLEFYEMFSRFYSGEGKPYDPVQIGDTHEN